MKTELLPWEGVCENPAPPIQPIKIRPDSEHNRRERERLEREAELLYVEYAAAHGQLEKATDVFLARRGYKPDGTPKPRKWTK